MQRDLVQNYQISILKSVAMLVLIIVLQAIGGAVVFFVLPEDALAAGLVAGIALQIITYLIAIYIFYWRAPARLNLALAKRPSAFYLVPLAIGWAAFACIVLIPIVEQMPGAPEVEEAFAKLTHFPWLAALHILVIAPIFEEIIFRNIIFKGLYNRYNLPLALLLSGVLFGAFHLNLPQLIPAALLGVVCGLLFWLTDSVGNTIIFHGLYNFFVMLMSGPDLEDNAIVALSPLYGWLALIVVLLLLWHLIGSAPRRRSQAYDTVVAKYEEQL